ncbi:hypothetical protein [Streptomyces sp. NPDC048606]|uniref:hypothetical protein n=1 Tax=Streptomyces sp. NPDC048606 TaxID=3154726 RepID=UPI0034480C4B
MERDWLLGHRGRLRRKCEAAGPAERGARDAVAVSAASGDAGAVGHLVRAGLLVYLSGEVEFPDVHPDEVAALARRWDLLALLDRYVPLGPDQAARRLGVPRTDLDVLVAKGFIRPSGSVDIDFKRQGGVTTVDLI